MRGGGDGSWQLLGWPYLTPRRKRGNEPPGHCASHVHSDDMSHLHSNLFPGSISGPGRTGCTKHSSGSLPTTLRRYLTVCRCAVGPPECRMCIMQQRVTGVRCGVTFGRAWIGATWNSIWRLEPRNISFEALLITEILLDWPLPAKAVRTAGGAAFGPNQGTLRYGRNSRRSGLERRARTVSGLAICQPIGGRGGRGTTMRFPSVKRRCCMRCACATAVEWSQWTIPRRRRDTALQFI